MISQKNRNEMRLSHHSFDITVVLDRSAMLLKKKNTQEKDLFVSSFHCWHKYKPRKYK